MLFYANLDIWQHLLLTPLSEMSFPLLWNPWSQFNVSSYLVSLNSATPYYVSTSTLSCLSGVGLLSCLFHPYLISRSVHLAPSSYSPFTCLPLLLETRHAYCPPAHTVPRSLLSLVPPLTFACFFFCTPYRASPSFSYVRLDVRIAAAKAGSLLATRMKKVDSHLAVVTGAVILAHEDVEKRTETFLEMLSKGQTLEKRLSCVSV